MSTNSPTLAHAASRFGLGGRPDTPITAAVNEWLMSQLGAQAKVAGPSLATCMNDLVAYKQAATGSAAQQAAQTALTALFASEQQNFMMQAVTTTTPFAERLVRFWANHFAMQCTTEATTATAGAFVRDVIRPNITGSFSTMLQAVLQHPGMLYSLNNNLSVGPQSKMGLQNVKTGNPYVGINENLGRETMELFTIGINADYTQADVDAMAYLLTGFSVNVTNAPYGFIYNPAMAQPGNSTLLGITYPRTQAGCLSALHMLATNHDTYSHLAYKLAVHFIADAPPADAVVAIAAAMANSGGSLLAATEAVLAFDGAWQPLTKLRTPQDYIIASYRAVNATAASSLPSLGQLALALGQPVWQPPFPNGWADLASTWAGPAELVTRTGFAGSFANQPTSLTTAEIVDGTVGPLLSETTQAAVAAAPNAATALAILLTSPEFERR